MISWYDFQKDANFKNSPAEVHCVKWAEFRVLQMHSLAVMNDTNQQSLHDNNMVSSNGSVSHSRTCIWKQIIPYLTTKTTQWPCWALFHPPLQIITAVCFETYSGTPATTFAAAWQSEGPQENSFKRVAMGILLKSATMTVPSFMWLIKSEVC